MSGLNRILAILAAVAGFLAMLFLGRQRKAERDMHKERADQAEAVNRQHHRLNQVRQNLSKKHQKEKEHEKEQVAKGSRDHLDDDW